MAYCPLTSPTKTIFSKDRPPNILEDDLIIELASKYGVEPSQIAIAWGISKGITLIPKTSNLIRAQQNIESVKVALEPEDIEKIDKLDTGKRIVDPEYYEKLYTPLFK